MEFVFLIGIVWLLVAGLWIWQFLDLMLMPDEDFPGRFDKVLWVVGFVVLFVLVAPIAFGIWKEKNRERLRKQRQPLLPDERVTPG